MSRNQHPQLEYGYSIVDLSKLELYNLPWRAAYGILLIRSCKAADKASERLGRYVQHYAPTEEEFRAMRNVFWRFKK